MILRFPSGAEAAYLTTVCERLRRVLGDLLAGVYVGGSYALGDYLPGRSDLDVAAVVRSPLSREPGDAVTAALRHEALPCPARRLELVAYLEDAARSSSAAPDFELNLNTGASSPVSVQRRNDPGDVGAHWFAIDRSILSQAGIALLGPPASEAFGAVALEELMPVLVESLRWHRDHRSDGSDAVLNACRSLRFAAESRWSSKRAAGRWAVEHELAPGELVRQAITARTEGSVLDVADVDAFLHWSETLLRRRFGGLGTQPRPRNRNRR